MIITERQMRSLSTIALRNYKVRILRHIQDCFPQQYSALGDECARVLVDLGVLSAQRYGFEGKRDICSFIDLMFIFGPDFDRDAKLPWARDILANSNLAGPVKMKELLDGADAALERLARL